MHHQDNAGKFEEVYEKLRKPYGNNLKIYTAQLHAIFVSCLVPGI